MEKKEIIRDFKKIKNKLYKLNKVYERNKGKLVKKIYQLAYGYLEKLENDNEKITKEVIDQAHGINEKIEELLDAFNRIVDSWYIWHKFRNDFWDKLEDLEKQAKGKKKD